MSVWDEAQHKWVTSEGRYAVWLGRSSSPRNLVRAGTISR
ncbi:MAG: fibronectin type III-like domain-contianing protein [Sphingomonadaceae bacterium]